MDFRSHLASDVYYVFCRGDEEYYLFAYTMLLYMDMQYQLVLIIFSLLEMNIWIEHTVTRGS